MIMIAYSRWHPSVWSSGDIGLPKSIKDKTSILRSRDLRQPYSHIAERQKSMAMVSDSGQTVNYSWHFRSKYESWIWSSFVKQIFLWSGSRGFVIKKPLHAFKSDWQTSPWKPRRCPSGWLGHQRDENRLWARLSRLFFATGLRNHYFIMWWWQDHTKFWHRKR